MGPEETDRFVAKVLHAGCVRFNCQETMTCGYFDRFSRSARAQTGWFLFTHHEKMIRLNERRGGVSGISLVARSKQQESGDAKAEQESES